MLRLWFLSIVMNWDGIMNPIGDMFNGIFGSPLLVGLVGLLFFLMIALALKINFDSMVVVMIPVLFVVFGTVPQLQIIVGIMMGVLIGLGLIKWFRR